MAVYENLLWLVLFVGLLLLLQRSLHREAQAIFLLLTRRSEIAIALFSLIFLPGVLLHESSHYLMARLLGVRTGRFSILPHTQSSGRLRLGFVETASSDWLRDSLIGAAPLIAGGIFVAYTGLSRLGLDEFWAGLRSQGWEASPALFTAVYHRPDFWLWFYLAFAVSSTMLPSESDRKAWLPLGLVLGLLAGALLLAGAGPWLAEHLAGPIDAGLQAALAVFGISLVIHALLLAPAWALRSLISHFTGLRVVEV